jgi:hypothetical protein
MLLVIVERNMHKTYFSPISLFAIPYITIVLYQVIITNIYDWDRISPIYLIVILFYIADFFLIGNLFLIFIKNNRIVKIKSGSDLKRPSLISNEKKMNQSLPNRYKAIEAVSIMSALLLLIYYIVNLRQLPDIGMIVQEDFQQSYSSGLNYYLRLISMIGTVYFWGLTSKNNKKLFYLGLLCFLPNFLTFVKGISFIMIIGGILTNILIYERKIKFKLITQIFISGVALFFLIYMIEIGIWNPEKLLISETYEFIFGKLNSYLISGVQSFNINITNNIDSFANLPNIVLAPISNVLAKLGIGERVETINDVWVVLGNIPSYGVSRVNTNTFIGTIALYNGIFKGLLVNSIISIVIYYFFFQANNKKNIIDISQYALFSAGIVLSWFDYYYMQTFWFYLIIIYVVFKIICKYKIRMK